jgi:hypothetical protein
MIISGISGTFNTSLDYKTTTVLSLSYSQLSNGNYVAIDRSTSADIYECDITTYGRESYIGNIIVGLDSIRNGNGLCQLSGFALNEKIFGENVDYSSPLSCVVTDYKLRENNSLNVYKLQLSLRLLSPTFDATPELPDFHSTCLGTGFKSDINRALVHNDTYYGDYYLSDKKMDSGIFEGKFNLTSSQLANLREYIRVYRDNIVIVSKLNGVNYMFGPSGGDFPHNVKIINIQEEERFSVNRFIVSIKFVKNY